MGRDEENECGVVCGVVCGVNGVGGRDDENEGEVGT